MTYFLDTARVAPGTTCGGEAPRFVVALAVLQQAVTSHRYGRAGTRPVQYKKSGRKEGTALGLRSCNSLQPLATREESEAFVAKLSEHGVSPID